MYLESSSLSAKNSFIFFIGDLTAMVTMPWTSCLFISSKVWPSAVLVGIVLSDPLRTIAGSSFTSPDTVILQRQEREKNPE